VILLGKSGLITLTGRTGRLPIF